jgi:hypothetical protein
MLDARCMQHLPPPPSKEQQKLGMDKYWVCWYQGFFFSIFFNIKKLANLSKKIANLHEFTLEKQKFPKISQLFCQRNDKLF